MWVAVIIQPRSLVKTDYINNEGLPLPVPDGIAKPGLPLDGLALRVRTPIHMDLTPHVSSAFEDDHDTFQFRLLKDLHRIRSRVEAWTAGWQAIAFGIVLGVIQRVVVVNRRSPGLKRNPRFRC